MSKFQIKKAERRGTIECMDSMEHYFTCPYCGEEISMVLDLSVRKQTYVEDCEVCCNPIEISYRVEDDALSTFVAKVLE
jgi:transcription elongation factor Elf1